MNYLKPVFEASEKAIDSLKQGKLPEDKSALAVSAVALGGLGVAIYQLASPNMVVKPSTAGLTGGSVPRNQVKAELDGYFQAYESTPGVGMKKEAKSAEATAQLVDKFYSLVTDIYEWGWGQSFHFSPRLPGKDYKASEAAHEAYIPALLHIKPGQKILDCGCGVGGPMRTIASRSGAHVTGITINDYQVLRAKFHNRRLGLQGLTDVVEGNFMKMPFENNSFDGAYAIEATCHAAKLELVYGEVFRVLKPGAYFATYEWVGTKFYDTKNPDHVKVLDEINIGNGLPETRTYKDAENAGKTVGFELVMSVDFATASPVCGIWYERLKINRAQHFVNHALVSFFSAIGLAPSGMREVHKMLVDVADSMVKGGELGIFSPMHLLLFRKKVAEKASA